MVNICPPTRLKPTLPVPTMTMAPSPPACAPRLAIAASLAKAIDLKGNACACRPWKAIAADGEYLPADAAEADAASAHDDNGALAARMRPEIGDRRIARKGDRLEGKRVCLQTLEKAAPVDPRD